MDACRTMNQDNTLHVSVCLPSPYYWLLGRRAVSAAIDPRIAVSPIAVVPIISSSIGCHLGWKLGSPPEMIYIDQGMAQYICHF